MTMLDPEPTAGEKMDYWACAIAKVGSVSRSLFGTLEIPF
jgi:hypothetical protein